MYHVGQVITLRDELLGLSFTGVIQAATNHQVCLLVDGWLRIINLY